MSNNPGLWPWQGFWSRFFQDFYLGKDYVAVIPVFWPWQGFYSVFSQDFELGQDYIAVISGLWPWQGFWSVFFPRLWPWQGLCCSYFWIIKRCTKYFMWALKTHILKDSWVYFSFLDIYASCKKYEFSA